MGVFTWFTKTERFVEICVVLNSNPGSRKCRKVKDIIYLRSDINRQKISEIYGQFVKDIIKRWLNRCQLCNSNDINRHYSWLQSNPKLF